MTAINFCQCVLPEPCLYCREKVVTMYYTIAIGVIRDPALPVDAYAEPIDLGRYLADMEARIMARLDELGK